MAATPGARQAVVEMGPVGDAGQTVEAGRELRCSETAFSSARSALEKLW